jgi:hypothetical protein
MDPHDDPTPTHLYINTSSASQTVPILKPGTAANGKITFGDTIGSRRMRAGDRLIHLLHLNTEAIIAHLPGDTRELLILTPHIRPL